MKFTVLIPCTALALWLAPALSGQVPASSPAPGLIVVDVPLMLPPQPEVRPAAAIAHVEVKLVPGKGGAAFTQRVPPEAGKVLAAVSAHLEKLHPGKLKEVKIEITFTGSVAAQDLAASGLGLAVALDATLGGWTPEPGFMAVGTFEADGDVQPVKDAIPRLLAVVKAGAKRVVTTEKQVAQVTDMMISSGPVAFAGTQFFSVNSYEDVKAIADTKRTPAMAKSLGFFTEVQEKLGAPGANPDEVLRDPDVKESLRDALTANPTCLSARLLLRVTSGQFDKLSAEGTLYAIETLAPTIFTVVQSRSPSDLGLQSNAVVQAEVARLTSAHKHFDTRALPVLDAVIGFGEMMRSYTERKPDDSKEEAARTRTLFLTARGVLDELRKFKTLKK